ncbi:class I SAM-dependent methyltransferase [Pseudonocardia adelaidensis]|uniref:S-adenosyl-L-methionine-dependent methyltransferase n=1 Tax=Pseudonocardia adelaidensis TaxID=648754 RepID=A0ABP9NQK3_9PSEU
MPTEAPESTAERVALWRAMHLQVDPPPHVLADGIGLRLADPGEGWRDRPDMDPRATAGFRAGVVARSRFIEDLVLERGADQYVILGAGLDTFAQRTSARAPHVRVFEVDQPGPQAWKRRRLVELGYGVPDHLRLVPVDLEAGDDWWARLAAAGFDPTRPAVVASAGVSMYLTKDATAATLRRLAGLAPGSTLVMTFQLPTELLDAGDRPMRQAVENAARASGTPFVSMYPPGEMMALAREAGFPGVRHVPGTSYAERYFSGRSDGLRPPSGEDLLIATT